MVMKNRAEYTKGEHVEQEEGMQRGSFVFHTL